MCICREISKMKKIRQKMKNVHGGKIYFIITNFEKTLKVKKYRNKKVFKPKKMPKNKKYSKIQTCFKMKVCLKKKKIQKI